ncbi:hypothetical protein FSW04_11160 [Baekduia soli]|uniref:Uncharacterized protein n=1 Tax=Baekduia soli TaxID=496014 RepID=A0A5B8U552_9ACTN|nr:hypothetical protein [Baekduia soli]QEC48071.1 hypothetical protein FSW04_11160 [Baekduia soli]
MARDPRRASVAAHVSAIARRSAGEGDAITSTMSQRCWPGGGDRHRPAAATWLRGWRPARAAVLLPVCACAAGACTVCN